MRDYTTIHLAAKNDSNGNPRRVYILLEKEAYSDSDETGWKYRSNIVAICDEEYSGRPKDWPEPAMRIDVPVSEYRWYINHGLLNAHKGMGGRDYFQARRTLLRIIEDAKHA